MGMIHKAITFATLKHSNQKRKGSDVPYIVHPFEVCQILSEMNCHHTTIIAGLLHDTLEDTSTTWDELVEEFNQEIADLVLFNSENKHLSWEERKQHTINFMKAQEDIAPVQICFADKLSNIRSLQSDYEILGDELWNRFKRGYEKRKWYYGNLLEVFRRFRRDEFFGEYEQIYKNMFEKTL